MTNVFGGSVYNLVFVILVLFSSVVSVVASILMLLLIKLAKTWNGYILLIVTMTAFQILYNLSFFSGVIDTGNEIATVLSNVCQLFGGLGTSLTANLIAYIAFYVIYYRHTLDVFQHYLQYMVLIMMPTLGIPSLYLISISSFAPSYITPDLIVLNVYYYFKIMSICVNFIFVTITFFTIRRMSSGSHVSMSYSEATLNKFTARLFYYPIVQTVSRIGFAWYEIEYGYNYDDRHSGFHFNTTDDDQTEKSSAAQSQQFAAQCVLALSMPVASIGYLLIFLLMHPQAYLKLSNILCCGKPSQQKSEEELSIQSLQGDDYSLAHHDLDENLNHQPLLHANKQKYQSSDQLTNYDGRIYCYSEEEEATEDEFQFSHKSLLSWFSYSLRSDPPLMESSDPANNITPRQHHPQRQLPQQHLQMRKSTSGGKLHTLV